MKTDLLLVLTSTKQCGHHKSLNDRVGCKIHVTLKKYISQIIYYSILHPETNRIRVLISE